MKNRKLNKFDYFSRFLKSYLFREIENFLLSFGKIFSLLKKNGHGEKKRKKKVVRDENLINGEKIKKFGIDEVIKKMEKKNLQKREIFKIDNQRDKTVSNFKNKKTFLEYSKNLFNVNSCDKKKTQKIHFNQFKFTEQKDKFTKLEKLFKLEKKMENSRLYIEKNFLFYEKFCEKTKNDFLLLKKKYNLKIRQKEAIIRKLNQKINLFEQENNFIKKSLFEKEENLVFKKKEILKKNINLQ
jgi:hypothetical protein